MFLKAVFFVGDFEKCDEDAAGVTDPLTQIVVVIACGVED